jgi:hypothetical protein
MKAPDYVVGEVGFGPSFCGEDANLRLKIAELEAEVAKLIKDRNVLRRALERCAALSDEVSHAKHEALLATAP